MKSFTSLVENYKIKMIDNQVEWNQYLTLFEDSNIYQTWDFAKTSQSDKIVKHIGIFINNNLIAIAAIRLKRIPFTNTKIAYIFRGPLWQKKDVRFDLNTFFNVAHIIAHEFLIKQKYLLILRPYIFSDQFQLGIVINKYDYKIFQSKNQYQTLVLNLNKDLDEINKSLYQKWRNQLNQAVKNNIAIISDTSQESYNIFLALYSEMIKRKRFNEVVSPENFGQVQNCLMESFKLKIFIAYKNNIPTAALVGSAIGNTGIYLFGATNQEGLKLKSAYLLQWEMIKWLKSKGTDRYDLGGIDKKNNPGVYKFKSGISKNEINDFGNIYFYNSKKLKFLITLIELFISKK